MSQENVEIVKMLQPTGVDLVPLTLDGVVAFGDLPDSLFAPDFESSFSAEASGGQIGPYYGAEGFVTAWRDWLEAWERYEIEAEDFIDVGDNVLAFVRVRGRTRRDKVDVEHAPAAVWTLHDGKVQAIRFYLDRQEGLKAVGLEG